MALAAVIAASALGGCGSGAPVAAPEPATAATVPPAIGRTPPPAPTTTAAVRGGAAADTASPIPARAAARRRRYPPVRPVAIDGAVTTRRVVALSFDADMTPRMLGELRAGRVRSWYAAPLIHELERTATPATLFLTGLWARTYPQVTRRLAAQPRFEIGSHTWDHLAWTSSCYGLPAVSTDAAKRRELRRTAAVLRRLTGRSPVLFRFPGLCHRTGDLRLVAAHRQQAIDGTASGDALQRDPSVIVRTVLADLAPGRIFVMHMMGGPNAPATAAAVRQLIPTIRARGYRLATVGALLRHRVRDAPSEQAGGA